MNHAELTEYLDQNFRELLARLRKKYGGQCPTCGHRMTEVEFLEKIKETLIDATEFERGYPVKGNDTQ